MESPRRLKQILFLVLTGGVLTQFGGCGVGFFALQVIGRLFDNVSD